MTIQEEAGKTVRSITDGLKGQPISLALIIMNVVSSVSLILSSMS